MRIILILMIGCNFVTAQQELNLLGTWSDSTLVASNAHNNTYNEIWGLVVDNREYAVIGSTFGTHFIDVTNPYAPVEVQRIPGKAQGTGIIHRDYHDHQGYLYAVCDEGRSSLQIMDITGLPDTIIMVYDSDALISRSHNIFIDTAQDMLYTMATTGSQIGGGAIGLIDISDPLNPDFLQYFNQFGDIRAGHVHDGFIKDDQAFLNCGNDGFAIVDFSDRESPSTLATLKPNEYPAAGYNHSGWTTEDGAYYYMADENHGFDMKTVNVANLNAIEVVGTFNADSDQNGSIPHNPVVSCDYLYIAYYYDGLQIYDITDPSDPVRSHYYPTSQIINDGRYKGAWGVYPFLPSGNILVSDMQNGLFIIEAVDPNCFASRNGGTTSISNHNDSEISVYPNPAFDKIEINYSGKQNIADIYSSEGKLLSTHTLRNGNLILDVSMLNKGMYLVRIGENFETIIKH